jgi:FPC/CPF motif-containing protein YcgG
MKESKNPFDVYILMNDSHLSLKAKGLAIYLELHADRDHSTASFVAHFKEGPGAIASAIKELKERDYLYVNRKREDGKYSGIEYILKNPEENI